MADSNSTPNIDKPVIVRVKRKAFQSPLDGLWLEILERPLKRPLLDFEKLSISDASTSREELKTKKVFVQHVETITSSEDTFNVLRSFVPNSPDAFRTKEENGQRPNIKTVNKQDQLLAKAKRSQVILSRNARFEQIWRRRKGNKGTSEDEAIDEMCRLYDVVRVDVEEHEVEVPKEKDTELDDCKYMAQFLPLLKEVIPTAAVEIEDDLQNHLSKQGANEGYVYDFYTVTEASSMEADPNFQFPLVQVDDDDEFYDGPDDSEYETDDSNAENNPMNEYPDEEETSDDEYEEEDEAKSESSSENSVHESRSSKTQSEASCDEYDEGLELDDWSDSGDELLVDEEEQFR